MGVVALDAILTVLEYHLYEAKGLKWQSKVILLVVIVADLAFQCSWGRGRLEVGFVRHSFGNILPKDRPTKRKTTIFLEAS